MANDVYQGYGSLPYQLLATKIVNHKVHTCCSQLRLPMMPGKETETATSLVDIDWQIGVVSASSVSGLKGKTYLLLKLMLEREDNSEESILTELDIANFYKLFHALKKASVALDEFS